MIAQYDFTQYFSEHVLLILKGDSCTKNQKHVKQHIRFSEIN